MRLGVLDIGSNSAQLQIVDAIAAAPPLPIHAVRAPTRLSETVTANGDIGEEGIDRLIAAVSEALSAARRFDVDMLYPFVTAAVRDAHNRDEVLDVIEAATGIRPQFLSGEQEGRFTYMAVRRWYGWQAGRILNVDIGGGSMELAFGRDALPEITVSLPLGAGRVSHEFLSEELATPLQIKRLRKHVRRQLRDVADRVQWEGSPRRVIATSKTFKQLARMAGAPRRNKGPFVPRRLRRADLVEWIPRLAQVPASNRAKFRGVDESRAHQILGGAVVAYETMRVLDVEQMLVSPWALREGIVLQHLAAVGEPFDRLTLQPLTTFGRTQRTATVTPLQSSR